MKKNKSLRRKVFISGGAGFIGSNVARHHLDQGDYVVVYDNLSRDGTVKNIKWLKDNSNNKNFKFIKGDIRDFKKLNRSLVDFDIIYHLAAQVAVTTSMSDPRSDFEINALGTFNMLEAFRLKSKKAVFIYSSTNKVYGNLEDLNCKVKGGRYVFSNKYYKKGVNEDRGIDFHSPYGCSKGAGDQYVRDFGRVFGLNTVVFRQSCIYGQRQFGNEDQGWVIHFVRTVLKNEQLKIFGDGMQVRDILHVDDLINAYQLAIKKPKISRGKIYNVGGGLDNSVSLLELINILKSKLNLNINYKFFDWREGDQKIYISDNSKLEKELNWKPKFNKLIGITKLINWAKTI